MTRSFYNFSSIKISILSIILILFLSSVTIEAQWSGQSDNLPGKSDSQMLTIVLVAVGVVAVGVATYFIIKSANSSEDGMKRDSTENDTTSQIINIQSYPSVNKLYSNINKIKDALPVQITAGLRRDNLGISDKQLYLDVTVNF